MKSFLIHFIALLKRLIFLLVLFTLTRIIFYIYNYNQFYPNLSSEIFKSFFYGIRFDFIVIYYLNIIFIILHLIPGEFKSRVNYQKTLKYLFIITNSLILLTNLIDIEYFKYTNKRSGYEMINMLLISSDTSKMIVQYIIDYWFLVLIWGLMIYVMWKFYPKIKYFKYQINENKYRKYIVSPLISIIFLITGFACVRGLKIKPIRIISANEYVKPKYSPILLNTPFTIINTLNQKKYEIKEYMDEDKLKDLYSPVKQYIKNADFKPYNILIIILESFSNEYIEGVKKTGKTYTPFLDSIQQISLVCKSAYANGNRSIDAIAGILSSLPNFMDEAIISSEFSINQTNSFSSLLEPFGYSTSFFHGGKNGTMGFDDYCKLLGIDYYFGQNQYPDKSHYDGSWGIYDEEFLLYTADELNKIKKPFFSTIFTLSSHPPYKIPDKYKNKFPEGEIEILKSIAYTDYSLKMFFEKISKEQWYNNTLFVFCADHTSTNFLKEYSTDIGRFSIPIIYYQPNDTDLTGFYTGVTQQIDILPSALDYINFKNKFVSFGSSIFDSEINYAYTYKNGVYQIIDNAYCLQFNGVKTIGLYDYRKDIFLEKNINNKQIELMLENKLKAAIQSFSTRMVNNKLTDTTDTN